MKKHLHEILLLVAMMVTTGVTQAKSLGEYIYLTGIDTTITVDKTSSCPSVGNITVTHITPDSIGIRWLAIGSETSWLVSDGVNEYVATDTMFCHRYGNHPVRQHLCSAVHREF